MDDSDLTRLFLGTNAIRENDPGSTMVAEAGQAHTYCRSGGRQIKWKPSRTETHVYCSSSGCKAAGGHVERLGLTPLSPWLFFALTQHEDRRAEMGL
ncbi:hypothetical protein MTO96_022147 [Rhipicephalus appendiculatus]